MRWRRLLDIFAFCKHTDVRRHPLGYKCMRCHRTGTSPLEFTNVDPYIKTDHSLLAEGTGRRARI